VHLSVTRNPAGDAVLTVAGEVDVEHVERLVETALATIAGGSHTLLIDLSQVTFIDSIGLGALIRIRNAAGDAPDALTLANPSPRVIRLLELTGLSEIFTIR
jgi:anti-sigma B factor antagonist